jgi:sulfate adenylyltransferase
LAAAGSAEVIAVPVGGPLTTGQVDHLAVHTAPGSRLLWLVLVGADRPGPRAGGLAPEALWRAVQALAGELGGTVVPLALPAGYDHLLPEIAWAYGADRVIDLPAPAGEVSPAFARELARAVRPPAERGLVVFFTGLSGSGKSTVAKALAERLLDDGRRSLTLLDGDEVRRLLSAGLGFSAADRDANIRRIGYVAAEVARHGGTAICAPIAPFAQVRAEVRAMVERAGGELVLVHVATPLAECERRDRKGLYARARRGELGEFTGISSPYEAPADADLVLDTTGVAIEDGVAFVWRLLQNRGFLVDDAQ